MKKAWNSGIAVYTKGGGKVYVKDNRKCLSCGTDFHVKQSQIDSGKGKYCSRICYMRVRSEWMKDRSYNPAYRTDFKLHKNPNWKGGLSFEPYALGWNKTYREQIRYRDGYRCLICGVSEVENGRKLSIHHIDYNKKSIEPKNLITVCVRCHSKTNYQREFWKKHLKEVMPNALTR